MIDCPSIFKLRHYQQIEITPTHPTYDLQGHWIYALHLAPLRLLLAGVYFMLAICLPKPTLAAPVQRIRIQPPRRAYKVGRAHKREIRRGRIPPSRDNEPYFVLLPRHLTPQQRCERRAHISALGRVWTYAYPPMTTGVGFQKKQPRIYRLNRDIITPASEVQSCGLSADHLWPD